MGGKRSTAGRGRQGVLGQVSGEVRLRLGPQKAQWPQFLFWELNLSLASWNQTYPQGSAHQQRYLEPTKCHLI